ncbi:MAG: mycothiol synthase [Cryobacterium sp.]
MATDLTPLDYTAAAARIDRVVAAARHVDGYDPLNEQAWFDLRAGSRTAWIVTTPAVSPQAGAADVGLLVTGNGELDLVIDPAHRWRGHGTAVLAQALRDDTASLTAWAHGDHPGARALGARFGFAAERTLLQLRRDLSAATCSKPAAAAAAAAATTTIDSFRPGLDDAEWLHLNALVFAGHPEQGALTQSDLDARRREHWFDPEDFLLARDADGSLIGYNWLKVEGSLGEIYVIGVHPDAAGQGLGRTLMQAGLERLRERGCDTVALYVEAESTGPVHLYRSLGFTDFTVDVQYRRPRG